MIQEFEKLHNLLNIPLGYNLKNTCGFSYETYYCYNNLEEEDVDWLTEEQVYIWDHTSEKKVLFKYEGYDNGCHSYFDYSIYLLTFNEIVEKINTNTDYKLKYGNDEDKEKIINRKKIIIQNLYNKSNAAEEFEY